MLIIILCILIALALMYCIGIAPGRIPKGSAEIIWEANYAHRGLHNREKTVPENSLAAFGRAADAGYGIELDLNLTTDNKVVVFHDDTLERVCGKKKAVSDCSYDELLQYRLFETDEKIPLFADVLQLIDGRVPLVVELKATKRNQELCQHAAAILQSYKGNYCIESFHPNIVRWFRKNEPHIVRGQLATGVKDYTKLPLYQAVMLSDLWTNIVTRPHFVAYNHRYAHTNLGLALYKQMGGKRVAWTVRDTDDIKWCEEHFNTIIFEFFEPKTISMDEMVDKKQ